MRLEPGQLLKLQQLLDRRYDALVEQIRDELEKSESLQYIELIDRAPADLGDQSLGDALADLNVAILDRHVQELRDIEAARARIEQGTFGVCVACAEAIAFERLLAYPTAKRCLRCQQQREKIYAHAPTPTL